MHDRDDWISERLNFLDIAVWRRFKADGDIAFFGGQRRDCPDAAGHLHVIGDPRVLVRELSYCTVYNTRHRRFDAKDPHGAATKARS